MDLGQIHNFFEKVRNAVLVRDGSPITPKCWGARITSRFSRYACFEKSLLGDITGKKSEVMRARLDAGHVLCRSRSKNDPL
jgi:hypothetical protein